MVLFDLEYTFKPSFWLGNYCFDRTKPTVSNHQFLYSSFTGLCFDYWTNRFLTTALGSAQGKYLFCLFKGTVWRAPELYFKTDMKSVLSFVDFLWLFLKTKSLVSWFRKHVLRRQQCKKFYLNFELYGGKGKKGKWSWWDFWVIFHPKNS